MVRRLGHAAAAGAGRDGGEVCVLVVGQGGEAGAALAEHGLRQVGARLQGVLADRVLEREREIQEES